VAFFFRKIWVRPFAVALVAAAVFLYLIFVQPSIVIGIFLDVGLIMLLVWAIFNPRMYT